MIAIILSIGLIALTYFLAKPAEEVKSSPRKSKKFGEGLFADSEFHWFDIHI